MSLTLRRAVSLSNLGWDFYSEQVRKAKYDLDEAEVKPYFELNNVLENGVFYAANQLYGITFKERKDIPVYQPDVRVFEVSEATASRWLFSIATTSSATTRRWRLDGPLRGSVKASGHSAGGLQRRDLPKPAQESRRSSALLMSPRCSTSLVMHCMACSRTPCIRACRGPQSRETSSSFLHNNRAGSIARPVNAA